jgi:hypothetical protein
VGILVVINVTVYFYYPETAGHSLEEMAVLFDGERAAITDDKAGLETEVVEDVKQG